MVGVTAILEARKVSKVFTGRGSGVLPRRADTVVAVDSVDLQLAEGTVLGLVGESGSGKTTLGRILANLETPTSGEVLLHGTTIASLTGEAQRAARRDVQMIFQNSVASLSPRRLVMDSLTEPMDIFGIGTREERLERANDLLRRVGLRPEHGLRYPHEFSGGQCQRINIARALTLRPRVLICDEPVSALDVSIQAQVVNLLLELQREFNLSFVFISHDLNVVRYLCDEIAVMFEGRIVERGVAERVYENPDHEYTKKLLHAIPRRNR